jgi:hypothetical protein
MPLHENRPHLAADCCSPLLLGRKE